MIFRFNAILSQFFFFKLGFDLQFITDVFYRLFHHQRRDIIDIPAQNGLRLFTGWRGKT
ncbi:Uncharacterised protein [Shigella sonnei]|nr:Uncharacterised protein [Shigella sonnei]